MPEPKKTHVRSFRLEVNILEKLDRAAKRAHITENAFLADLLEERLVADPLVPAFQEITLSAATFQSILSGTNVDALEAAASQIAIRDMPLVNALYESNDQTFNSQILVTDILGKHWRWFCVEGNTNLTYGRLALRHEYGLKWSKFLMAYLEGACGILSNEKLDIKISDQFIRVGFKDNHPEIGENRGRELSVIQN